MAPAVKLDMTLEVVSEARHFAFRIAPQSKEPLEHFRYYVFTPKEKKLLSSSSPCLHSLLERLVLNFRPVRFHLVLRSRAVGADELP
jgi:hypothetical protein